MESCHRIKLCFTIAWFATSLLAFVQPTEIELSFSNNGSLHCNDISKTSNWYSLRLNCSSYSTSQHHPVISFGVGEVSTVLEEQVNLDQLQPATSYRIANLNVTMDNNGEEIMCSAIYDGISTPLLASITLEVGAPRDPANVTVLKSSSTPTSLDVTWQNGSTSPIMETYSLTYCLSGTGKCLKVPCIENTSYTINGLSSFRQYDISVRAINAFGSSAETSIGAFTFKAPLTINLRKAESGRSVADDITYCLVNQPLTLNCSVPTPCYPPPNITWLVPSGMKYYVHDQEDWRTRNGQRLVTSFSLLELNIMSDDGGKYIRCFVDHYGLSKPFVKSSIFKLGNLPKSPTNISTLPTSSTSILITWSSSEEEQRLTQYFVEYCNVVNNTCKEMAGIKNNSLNVTGLAWFTIYRITVKSYTVFGYSVNNTATEAISKVPAPDELGVQAVVNLKAGWIHIELTNQFSNILPEGVCIKILFNNSKSEGEVYEECIPIHVSISYKMELPRHISSEEIFLVTCWNDHCSIPSEVDYEDSGGGFMLNSTTLFAIGTSSVIIVSIIVIATCMQCRKRDGWNRNLPRWSPVTVYWGG